jgi:transposase
MPYLNYQFRIYPTEEQKHHLSAAMRFDAFYWNRLRSNTNHADDLIKRGFATRFNAELAQMLVSKSFTGRKASNLLKLQRSGLSETEAKRQLQTEDYQKAWKAHGSGLAVEWACQKTDIERKKSSRSSEEGSGIYGSIFAAVTDRFRTTWKNVWKKVPNAEPPKKKKISKHATTFSVQLQGKDIFSSAGVVNLSGSFPGRLQLKKYASLHNVKVRKHRAIKAGGTPKEYTIKRTSTAPDAKWYVVVSVQFTDKVRDYPHTDVMAGIDPGRSVALAVAYSDGVTEKIDPGKPLANRLKRLAFLQKKLDNQRRMCNPESFDEKGRCIKNRKATNVTKRMQKTEAAIRKLHMHIKAYRTDFWHKKSNDILKHAGTVGIGNWKPSTPQQKRKLKARRKEISFKHKAGGKKRERTQNRNDSDNSLGMFRRLINEKAESSVTSRDVKELPEAGTTIRCSACGNMTGPKNNLSIRQWTCENCGTIHDRDVNSAQNDLHTLTELIKGKVWPKAMGDCSEANSVGAPADWTEKT